MLGGSEGIRRGKHFSSPAPSKLKKKKKCVTSDDIKQSSGRTDKICPDYSLSNSIAKPIVVQKDVGNANDANNFRIKMETSATL